MQALLSLGAYHRAAALPGALLRVNLRAQNACEASCALHPLLRGFFVQEHARGEAACSGDGSLSEEEDASHHGHQGFGCGRVAVAVGAARPRAWAAGPQRRLWPWQ